MGPLAGGGMTGVQPRHAKIVTPRPPSEVYGKARQASDRRLAPLEGSRVWYRLGIPRLTGTMLLAPFEGIAAEDPCHGTANVRRDSK